MQTILIVEDDLDSREMLAIAVTAMGYEVIAVTSAEEALATLAQRSDVRLVICDIRLPRMDGILFKELINEQRPLLKIAFVTGDEDAADAAIRAGVVAMLKPYKFEALTRVIAEALGKN
jgi:DNA-binding NtrC family response regulator